MAKFNLYLDQDALVIFVDQNNVDNSMGANKDLIVTLSYAEVKSLVLKQMKADMLNNIVEMDETEFESFVIFGPFQKED